MVREVVIKSAPRIKPDLLGTVQELKELIDELVDGISVFAGSPTFPMTLERYDELGKLFRLIVFCRMYARQFSDRSDYHHPLAKLVDRDRDRPEYDEVQWVFTGLPALDGIRSYAEEVGYGIIMQEHGRVRDIAGLLELATEFKRNLDLFVGRVEGFARAGALAQANT
jgi:hypothetical protein